MRCCASPRRVLQRGRRMSIERRAGYELSGGTLGSPLVPPSGRYCSQLPYTIRATFQRRTVGTPAAGADRTRDDRSEGATMTRTGTRSAQSEQSLRGPVLWGLVFGAMQASLPVGFWWLDQATVHAMSISLIAAVYIGFAVADGRPRVIAVECTIAGAFVVIAAAGVTGTAWLLVAGYAGHGLKDFWQERRHYVANTRWWPPFCATVDWLVAVILVIEIAAGVNFQ